MRSSLQRSLVALMSGAALLTAACSGSDSSGPAACAVSAVSVSSPPSSIEVGASVTLNASITQQNCSGLTTSWSSSNPAVASVSATGEVVGVAIGGPVTITATVSGKSGTANLSVVPATVATITLANPYNNLTVGVQNTVTASLKDARGTALTDRTVTWSSSDPTIATVTPAGVVQAVALGGPVNITATSEGKTASLPITVVPRYAYAFANAPSATAPYDGNSLSSYSTVGAPTTIARTAPGVYSVRFRNMATSSQQTAVLASAFGPGNSTCKADLWVNDGADIVTTVNCRDVTDAGADQQFFVTLFGRDAFPGRFAFTWADQQSAAAAYSPNSLYSYNAAGQPIQITHTATGSYTVQFVGNGRAAATDPAETFHVSAYGGVNTRCEVVNWSYVSASVSVRCSDVAGAAVDSRFVLVMLEAGRPSARHALAWANCMSASCAPTTAYARSNAGTISVNRLSNGRYEVVFAGQRRTTGTDNVLVTSYGSTGGFCKLTSVDNTGASDLTATVQCFSPGASLSDRLFDVSLIP